VAFKIALDATPLTVPKSGIGEYSRQLAQHLAQCFPGDEFLLLSNFQFPAVPGPSNLGSIVCSTNWMSGRWWLVGLSRVLKDAGVTVFHGTDYSVPMLPLLPSVLTIHDLSSIRLPQLHERRTRRTARRLRWMVRVAAHIVTPTRTIREEILRQFFLSEESVSVIPLAPGPQFHKEASADAAVLEKYGLSQPYVLFVGTLEPRKNLVTLVQAFAALPSALRAETQLVLCGRRGWHTEELLAEIDRRRLRGKVQLIGHVCETDLPSLYRAATVFAYPSVYEGFGLPPLEAMASGVPVIASTASAVTEVLGDSAVLVPPEEPHAWRDALQNLLNSSSLRKDYVRRGLLHAQDFSWVQTAEQTYAVYEKVLAEHSPKQWHRPYRTLLDWIP
jgi:glycosyltransferase involved in cell wall biosynthesis